MVNRRFVCSIVAGLVLALALVACSNDDDDSGMSAAPAPSQAPAPAPESTPAPTLTPTPAPVTQAPAPAPAATPTPEPEVEVHVTNHGHGGHGSDSCVVLGDVVFDCPPRSLHAWKPAKQQVPGEVWVFPGLRRPEADPVLRVAVLISAGSRGQDSSADGATAGS